MDYTPETLRLAWNGLTGDMPHVLAAHAAAWEVDRALVLKLKRQLEIAAQMARDIGDDIDRLEKA